MKCPYCISEIPDESIICQVCNSFVKDGKKRGTWFKRNSYWINWFGILLSLGLFILGFISLNQSIKERVDAQTALNNANTAIRKSNESIELSNNAIEKAKTANEQSDSLLRNSKQLLTQMIDLQNNTVLQKNQLQRFQAKLLSNSDFFDFVFIRTGQGQFYNPEDQFPFVSFDGGYGYQRLDMIAKFNSNSRNKFHIDSVCRIYFDFFELAFFNFLCDRYAINWIYYYGDDGGHYSPNCPKHLNGYWPKPKEGEFTIWSKKSIKQNLKDNFFFEDKLWTLNSIYLPPNTKVTSKKSYSSSTSCFRKYIREINFENQDFNIKISLTNGGEIKLDSLQLEAMDLEYLDLANHWYMQGIRVNFEANFTINNSFTERSVLESNWIEQMIEMAKYEFDWEDMYEQIKSYRILE